ncbi:MAG: Gfo/Idh/MocA family oxidoreductase [Acholeplasmataceae bacterium]|nr:Gfo/Idh/MocA family oxidoreductase [Acholeplasmataceae bacterium]
MRKLRVGIIGCGNIFPMHAISIKKNDQLELVAVCDNKKERAVEAASKYDAVAYFDYEKMFKEARLDVVHICTPHYLHAPMTIAAAEHKIHVLTEKPMSINVEDANRMIEACRENQVSLGVIFQNRYNKGAIFLKERIESGRLGKIRAAKCQITWDRNDAYYMRSDWKGTWDKEGGGVVIDQAIHTLDLMCWFIGEDIEYIDATIANRVHKSIDVEDTSEGMIKFENGIIGTFHVINYYTTDSPVTIEFHCEKGLVKYTDGLTEIIYDDESRESVGSDPREHIDYGDVKSYWGVSHVKQIHDFYESIKQNKKPAIDGYDAIITQKVVNAIYQSGKTGEKVYYKS